jgi:hypothetical protein
VTFRLERDGFPTLHLTPDNGFTVRSVDLGFPAPRTVVDSRPQANGTDDRTRFLGDRVVTLDLLARGERQQKIDQLGPFLVPNARSFLYFQVGNFERRVLLRGRSRSAVYDVPGKQEILVQWDAPNGTVETANARSETALASGAVEPGFTFDIDFDLTFPASTPVGTTSIVTVGNAECPPIIQLWGPVVNPRIINITDGNRQLRFDVTLTTEQFWQVDFRERTVFLNGDPNRNRYQQLDFTASEWWTLLPGTNFVRYTADTFASPARAVVSFRCQWI